jgi:hypothetical protein
MAALAATQSWQALTAHFARVKDAHLRTLCAEDPGRTNALINRYRRLRE